MKLPPVMLNERDKKPSPVTRVILCIFYVFAFFLLIVLLINQYLNTHYGIVDITGRSMMNTFMSGDAVYAEFHRKAQRGDVITVDVSEHHDVFTDQLIIKRLIAVEGDSVKGENGVIWRKIGDGEYEPLDEPYVWGRATGKVEEFAEVVLGKGEIFAMGDNRVESRDSREIEVIKAERLQYSQITSVVPQWAIEYKWYSTGWKNLRNAFVDFFYEVILMREAPSRG